ncbi:MAG: TetR family transcriptional regulator [Mycobacterium sp.]|jgi:AcrR family transcriptional regulator|nr:TetR family transcriptional regulator [Mycobacterium sp.]
MQEQQPTTSRRTQEERRTEARRRVLEAATELVAQHGSRSVSLAAVGDRAGYSRGIVNHHFGSKTRLVAAVLEHSQNFATPDDAATGLGRLTELIRTYLGVIRDRSPRPEAFLQLWAESMGAEPTLKPLFTERDSWFQDLLSGHIRDGIADGSVRPDADPDTTALTVVGLLRGTAMLLLSTADEASATAVAGRAAAMVERDLATSRRTPAAPTR